MRSVRTVSRLTAYNPRAMGSINSTSPTADESFSLRWWVAFSLLILAVHEAHELVHVVTGRVLCGTWAERDFNAWWFTQNCQSVVPTLAGPLFSYAVTVMGALIALKGKPVWRWAGIALLFSANPFARIFTAVVGGGDEMVVGRYIAGVAERTLAVRLAVLFVVGTICGAAIFMGWRAMYRLKRRTMWFVMLLIWPMVLTGTLLFLVGNRLLRAGVLVEPKVGGAPFLVVVVTVVVFSLAAMTTKWLSRANAPKSA